MRQIDNGKIEKIKDALHGLTEMQWRLLKDAVDMYFNKKATDIKIDDLEMLSRYFNSHINQ